MSDPAVQSLRGRNRHLLLEAFLLVAVASAAGFVVANGQETDEPGAPVWMGTAIGRTLFALAVERGAEFSREDESLATALSDLATVYARTGRLEEAEQVQQRALAIQRRVLGRGHPDVARSLRDLASIYVAQGWDAPVEPLLAEALSIRQEALGPQHELVVESLNDLAAVEEKAGRSAEAERLYASAFAIAEANPGAMSPHLVKTLDGMASLERGKRRYDLAEQHLTRALALAVEQSRQPHSLRQILLTHLGALDRSIGSDSLVEHSLHRALAATMRALETRDRDVAVLLNNRGIVRYVARRYRQAEADFTQALAIESGYRAGAPLRTKVLANLGILYARQGRKSEARAALERALTSAAATLRRGDPLERRIRERLAAMDRAAS